MLKIGTRESALAVWQATEVQKLLAEQNVPSELVYIKSEGDVDLVTPLYAMGVQGVFTRTLDAALLSGKIDLAVHSMKDVPVQLAQGITEAAVLERASHKDIFVPKAGTDFLYDDTVPATIATSSVRRKAQWLRRYPHHTIEGIRGNVNTRLKKAYEQDWAGVIFAAAGLERIGLRPANAVELHWMLPAPAQGAIMVVCNEGNKELIDACKPLHDLPTGLCVHVERQFLHTLMGGCSAPVSAFARLENDTVFFKGNVLSLDGSEMFEIEKEIPIEHAELAGSEMAEVLLEKGARKLMEDIRKAGVQ